MPKEQIVCMFHDGERSEYDITVDGRVWPCCKFVNAITKIESGQVKYGALEGDDYFFKLRDEDPNWNSLEHHTLDEILEHDYFQNYVSDKGWKSGNTSILCKLRCSALVHDDGKVEYIQEYNKKIHKRET